MLWLDVDVEESGGERDGDDDIFWVSLFLEKKAFVSIFFDPVETDGWAGLVLGVCSALGLIDMSFEPGEALD